MLYIHKQRLSCEIIIVDDGSSDNTAEVIAHKKQLLSVPISLISYPKNQGKGFAVKTGVSYAEGSRILVCDADLSVPISQLPKLEAALSLHAATIVIGSRYMPESSMNPKPKWYRTAGSRTGYILNKVVLGCHFKDTQCGFKLYRASAAKKIFSHQKINRFYFEVEMLTLARLFGFTIAEVPVHWKDMPHSSVTPLLDAFRNVRDLVRIHRFLAHDAYQCP